MNRTINPFTPMKPLPLLLSATLILPTALLLCQCAAPGPKPSKLLLAVQTSATPGAPTPPLTRAGPSLRALIQDAWSTRGDNEPLEAPADTDQAASEPIRLAPLIVTENLNSVLIAGMRYWPPDAADAEQKKAWLSLPQTDEPKPYPMGDSGQAWLTSLR